MFKSFTGMTGGIVKDVLSYDLADNAWTDGENVRFFAGGVEKIRGDTDALSTTPVVIPYYAQSFVVGAQTVWSWFGFDSIFVTNGTTVSDLSKLGGYSTDTGHGWTGGVLKGVSMATNGVDPPQKWLPDPSLQLNYADLLYDFSASTTWADASVSAQLLRTHGDYAIAMDTTENGVRNRRRVWWSNAAEALTEPSTWDYSKPAFDAGFVDLDDTFSPIVDGVPLRDSFLIYKEDSVYRMYFVPNNDVFNFKRLFSSFGALSRHCAQPFFGKHLVATNEDIIVHDGTQTQSILHGRLLKWYSATLDPTYANQSFVAVNLPKKEVWICIPEAGVINPSLAIIWSWEDNSITFRDLHNAVYGTSGKIGGVTGTSFDSVSGTFDDDAGPFDQSVSKQTSNRLCLFTLNSDMLAVDSGERFQDTGKMTAYVEKAGMPLEDRDRFKFVKAIYPRIEGSIGSKIQVWVGAQNTVGEKIRYKKYTFSIGDNKVGCRVTGRYIAVRFQTEDVGFPWRLQGFDIEYELGGRN